MQNDSSAVIVAALHEWIATAPAGARLPSTRELVLAHGASPVTVQKALRVLSAEGLVESRPGVGTFVRTVRTARPLDYGWQTAALGAPVAVMPSSPTAMRDAAPDSIALHAGYPDRELLPERIVRTALTRAARADTAFTRAPLAGLPELRSWFASEVAASAHHGVTPPTPNDVIVVPGSQSALSSIFRALVTAGRPLLVESPTYWGAILAAAQAGVRVIPIPTGPFGPDPDDVARAFRESGARAFYAQPNYANPTGAQWSGEISRLVLDTVRASDAFLIEDDWAHDFGISTDCAPLVTRDDAGNVVYIRSLTKTASPALRVGAVIARGPARERILADTGAASMYTSGVLQRAALEVVTDPAWQRHLRGLRGQLRARRDLLIDSIAEHAPLADLSAVPPGGLNLWLRLPDGTDTAALARDCAAEKVLIADGAEWFPAEAPAPFIRLNFAGPNPAAFPDATRVIGRALERQN